MQKKLGREGKSLPRIVEQHHGKNWHKKVEEAEK